PTTSSDLPLQATDVPPVASGALAILAQRSVAGSYEKPLGSVRVALAFTPPQAISREPVHSNVAPGRAMGIGASRCHVFSAGSYAYVDRDDTPAPTTSSS